MISTPKQTITASTSPQNDFKEDFVCKRDFEEVLRKLNAYEKEIKEKDAMIEFNRKIVVERDQSLNKLKEEVRKHELEFKPNVDFIFKHSIPLKTSSMASTIGSSVSTFTTKSVKSEDLNSISSMDSVVSEKPKKSAKYSTRKRKPNLNNSMDKRYLKSVDSNLDTSMEPKSSQSSVTASEPIESDCIGEAVFSSKKCQKKGNKRKQTNSSVENEDYSNMISVSKRKRPPLKSLYSSPISPIPSAERVTRSRAKKSIKF